MLIQTNHFSKYSLLFYFLILGVDYVKTKSSEANNLELLGFLPMTGKGWVGGAACLPAVLMALRHVNERKGLLDGYNLTYSWVDSQVKLFSCAMCNVYDDFLYMYC